MSKILCWIIGHQPRGPVRDEPVLYSCERCKELIQFDRECGWRIYHDDQPDDGEPNERS